MARKSRSKPLSRKRAKRRPSLLSFLRFRDYGIFQSIPLRKIAFFSIPICVLTFFYYSSYPQQIWDRCTQTALSLSQKAGFVVNEIVVVGQRSADPQAILKAIQVKAGDPIFSVSPYTIMRQLEENTWIRQATVQRKLPDTYIIQVVERQPIAVWQHQEKLYLVDDQGVVVSPIANQSSYSLPLIIGKDAPLYAPQVLKILESFPQVQKRVCSLMYVSSRRWNVFLDKTLEVRLPEQGMEKALARLALLIDQKKLDSQEIYMVDLRIPDRTVIRLSSAGSARLRLRGRET